MSVRLCLIVVTLIEPYVPKSAAVIISASCPIDSLKQNETWSACVESTAKRVNFNTKKTSYKHNTRDFNYLLVTIGNSGLCCCVCVTL